ncbi:hypothetical protein TNCV_2477631 [Trichonephila clavipes]|nr:hypothetical protein TNCV_2477631 [Trichonephila clavipes]
MFQILLWYPWKGKKEYVPLRTAYSQDSRYGMQPKARQSSRAGAAKTRTETFELVEEKQKLLDIRKERTRESYDMAAVDFLHHENPPTWAGVQPATLGGEGQRQTNHATQPAERRPKRSHYKHLARKIQALVSPHDRI